MKWFVEEVVTTLLALVMVLACAWVVMLLMFSRTSWRQAKRFVAWTGRDQFVQTVTGDLR